MPICKTCKKSAASVEMKDGVCRYCRGKAERISIKHTKSAKQSNTSSKTKNQEFEFKTFHWLMLIFIVFTFLYIKLSDRSTKNNIVIEETPTISNVAKGTYPACENKETYSEFVAAIMSAGMESAVELYIPKGCTIIFKDTPLSVTERNWSTAKVIFDDPARKGETVIMYTAIEAVR